MKYLKGVNTGGMSYYTVEGSGKIKAERITVGRGTAQTQPDYIPRIKVEVVVKDYQVDELISKITDKLGSERGGKIFVVDVPIAVDIGTKRKEKMLSKEVGDETPDQLVHYLFS